MLRPPLDWFPCEVGDRAAWGPWIRHEGEDQPSFVRDNMGDLRKPSDPAIYVGDGVKGWGRNWSPPWSSIIWFRLLADHPFYAEFAKDLERRCVDIADEVVPAYRHGARAYGCTGHTAKRWQAAYDGARIALGGAA